MKVAMTIFLVAILGVFSLTGSSFGSNITIYDGRGYSGTGQGGEDGETEPGMINSQVWDLEAFLLNGNKLSMVGGWNFKTGAPGYSYESGDIFIDTNGDAWYGKDVVAPAVLPSNYGYEYVLDVEWASGTYKVYSLGATSNLVQVLESYNQIESNPWRLSPSLENEIVVASGSFVFEQGLTDAAVGFLGGSHYSVSGFDLSFLNPGTTFIAHFTMGCGNDNLIGQGTTPVPEPATMLLLGTGLIGLAGFGRKKLLEK
jgi:hypothetical protein